MKNIFLCLIAGFILCYETTAQSDSIRFQFESLKLNSAPAFVALGIEPENIQRPSSPTQFISGLQNSIVNGKLKPNVAFEFTPFYISKPKDEDSTKFRPAEYILAPSNFVQRILKTTSFSLATSESDTVAFGKLNPGTGLGIGIRFLIAEAKPKKGVVNLLKEWNEAVIKASFYNDIISKINSMDDEPATVQAYSSLILDLASDYEKISLLNPEFNALSYSYSKKIIENIASELLNGFQQRGFLPAADMVSSLRGPRDVNLALAKRKLDDINSKGTLPFTKQGFTLEFAAGEALVLQDNQFKKTTHAKTSFWLTPAYRWQLETKKGDIKLFDLMGVLRYTLNNTKDSVDVANYFDAGVKIQYTKNVFSFSFEGVYRHVSELPQGFTKKHTWRWVTNFDYKISDLLTFKFCFGGNFNGNVAEYTKAKDMFAIGGLNLGLFDPQK
jgi:hypothetical protein